ncbi:transposase family protein [Micromonospora chersina]|uniref:transposase family protein n=1 Tax=Micromonospora chersina TaxID=47854 RepID=UPI0037B5BC89
MLTLYLMRRNESQAVAGELFGCSQSTVSRVTRRLRPLLRQATAQFAGQIRSQAKRSAVIVDGFLAPTGQRAGVTGMYSGKRHQVAFNVQAVADLAGRLMTRAYQCRAPGTGSRALDRVRHRRPVGQAPATRRARHTRRPGLPGHRRDHRHPQTTRTTTDRRPTRLQHGHRPPPRRHRTLHLNRPGFCGDL